MGTNKRKAGGGQNSKSRLYLSQKRKKPGPKKKKRTAETIKKSKAPKSTVAGEVKSVSSEEQVCNKTVEVGNTPPKMDKKTSETKDEEIETQDILPGKACEEEPVEATKE